MTKINRVNILRKVNNTHYINLYIVLCVGGSKQKSALFIIKLQVCCMKNKAGRQFTSLISIAAKLNSFKGGVKLPTSKQHSLAFLSPPTK